MNQAMMKIQKADVPLLLLSALGGFLLVFLSLAGKNVGMAAFLGLALGVPSGMGGGTLACIFGRCFAKK